MNNDRILILLARALVLIKSEWGYDNDKERAWEWLNNDEDWKDCNKEILKDISEYLKFIKNKIS